VNVLKAIALKVASALLFAVMSALVRYLGEKYPVGQIVFFRSTFAILPVVLIYAWRNELAAAVRTTRPLGHVGRGLISIGGMFGSFSALARLPIVDATAISFAAPLITVAFAAIFLRERVRIYRWSAVIAGFGGILVMLGPHFDLSAHAGAAETTLGFGFAIGAAFCNAGGVIQTRRLTQTETTSSIVFYFSLICALAGLATWPLGRLLPGSGLDWLEPTPYELVALVTVGLCGGLAHILLTERSLGASLVGGAVRLHIDGMGLPARLFLLRRIADGLRVRRRCHHRRRWPIRDLARASARIAAFTCGRRARDRRLIVGAQNALNVIIVWVSWMPGMVCTFSFTKWPMSVLSST
jgi:drug/metabolite transporter (DMT)-like permease